MGTWMLLTLLATGWACVPECLANCSGDCLSSCGCSPTEACEVCQSSGLPCSQECGLSARLLPKPNSVTPGLNSPAFPEDFELTKAERCKATCQTFCEIRDKPGHCPGMCELLFCYQSLESLAVQPSNSWPLKCVLAGTLLALVGLAVHVKRS